MGARLHRTLLRDDGSASVSGGRSMTSTAAGRTDVQTARDINEVQLLQQSIEHQQHAEQSGFWRSCSGCHEAVDGYSGAPVSGIFGCQLGNGCSECGGIGAVWDDTDYDDMVKSMQENEEADAISAAAPGLIKALEEIRDMPCSQVNDSESLRHTIKTLRHIATTALAAAKTGDT